MIVVTARFIHPPNLGLEAWNEVVFDTCSVSIDMKQGLRKFSSDGLSGRTLSRKWQFQKPKAINAIYAGLYIFGGRRSARNTDGPRTICNVLMQTTMAQASQIQTPLGPLVCLHRGRRNKIDKNEEAKS
jgi:hypothetical protein